MDKEDVLYIYTMESYSSIKIHEILPLATWMNLDGTMLSEISQMEKDKYCMISLIWNIKIINEQTEPNKNKHVD